MAEFAYNNARNISSSHMSFELNYKYHFWIFYKKEVDPCFKYKSIDKLAIKLRKLMIVCRKNLYHTEKF